MNELSKRMTKFVYDQLQIGDQKPIYILHLKRPEKFNDYPIEFSFPDGAIVNIETGQSDEFGAATATISIENCYGFRSPEFGPEKHADDNEDISDFQLNPLEREYQNLLQAETWIRICLGYGGQAEMVLTGAIDSTEINSKESKITISVRDNMRYLIDQNIDALKFGKKLVYPRTDYLVIDDTMDKQNILQISRTSHFIRVIRYFLYRHAVHSVPFLFAIINQLKY